MTRAFFGTALLLTTIAVNAQTFDLKGFSTLSASQASGNAPWMADGFGRFDLSGDDATEYHATTLAGFDWTPSQWLSIHASGVARREPDSYAGEAVGLVEAYVDLRTSFGNDELQLRAGQFFLPTSRENKGALWTSPYALSFSALNSWIAQEFRPIGADLQWRHALGPINTLTLGATAFRGNDTMGTLIAWRGWTIGNRLSVYNEVLPLPPHPGLARWFPDQRADGTKPFGEDLDGATALAGRVRLSFPERGNIQFAHVDNPAHREIYNGEYAWETNFSLISAEIGRTEGLILAAEYMLGETGMGFRGSPWVQVDFYAAYAMLSQKVGRSRFTGRYDWFSVEEADFSAAGDDSEDGVAWTLAYLHDLTDTTRLGFEFTQINAERPNLVRAGLDPQNEGRSVTVEVRYGF